MQQRVRIRPSGMMKTVATLSFILSGHCHVLPRLLFSDTRAVCAQQHVFLSGFRVKLPHCRTPPLLNCPLVFKATHYTNAALCPPPPPSAHYCAILNRYCSSFPASKIILNAHYILFSFFFKLKVIYYRIREVFGPRIKVYFLARGRWFIF